MDTNVSTSSETKTTSSSFISHSHFDDHNMLPHPDHGLILSQAHHVSKYEDENGDLSSKNKEVVVEEHVAAADGGSSGGSGGPVIKKKKAKNPKIAFQTRSQVDILDDGYRWRKYGQKAVKNNKFARSYYKCTYQGCNVKKQVQRLSKDEGVVVTTYEGMHTHPIDMPNENFNHILTQMNLYPSHLNTS